MRDPAPGPWFGAFCEARHGRQVYSYGNMVLIAWQL
jgi:hypothetical protein